MVGADSATYCNLQVAFSKECELFSKYIICYLEAERDGFSQIAQIFYNTAINQLEHAKIWMSFIEKQDVQAYLYRAAQTEYGEMENMYRDFSKIAKREKYFTISDLFSKTAQIEKQHRLDFLKLYEELENGKAFYSDNKAVWRCAKCGLTYISQTAPQKCGLCGGWQGNFIKSE